MRLAITCLLLALLQVPKDLQDHMPVLNDPNHITLAAPKGDEAKAVVLPGEDCASGPWKKVGDHIMLNCEDDVPAVWKTQKTCSYVYPEGGGSYPGDPGCGPIREHAEWTCDDQNRALLVSVNGKKAVCHKLD